MIVIVSSRRLDLRGEAYWLAYTKTEPYVAGVAADEQTALDLVHAALEEVLQMKGEYLGQAHG